MKKIIFFVVLLITIMHSFLYAKIQDIDNHWAKEVIQEAEENLLVSGYPDSTFKPDHAISMNEFLKIMIKATHTPLIIEEEEVWPKAYLKTAMRYGFIKENEISETITRNEAAMILARYLKSVEAQNVKSKMVDISDRYEKDILKLISLGVAKGYEDNTYRGENSLSRAEALMMIQ